jgi:hypothetical protein
LFSLMRQPYLIDGRNIYEREEMERLGFVYWGLGRGIAESAAKTSTVGPSRLGSGRVRT